MPGLLRVLKMFALLLLVGIVGGGAWLYHSPPELLRIGDGYAAKIVCSNVFISGRDETEVLENDVQAPGNPLLRLIRVKVDRERKRVTARILGLFAPGYAMYRGAFGCTAVPGGDFEEAERFVPDVPDVGAANGDALWPDGERVDSSDEKVAEILDDPALTGGEMRAVVVVHDGRIIAERYSDGFDATTALIGWSMTKTVNAALVGRLMQEGRISLTDDHLLPRWGNSDYAQIRLSDLMGMESGLKFNEDYGAVADVTRMLYLDPDMTDLPASRPLAHRPGTVFDYSSGSSVLISRIWMDRAGDAAKALAYPETALFGPLGMTSAVFEVDARGTFAGSSYLYATGRDWARFGLFLLQDGVWDGQRLLPESFMTAVRAPTEASDGKYTKGQAWLAAPGGDPSRKAGLPADTFWMEGHDGQSVAIVPSAGLVVVRLGLTPSRLGYRPQGLVKAILAALPAKSQ